MRILYVTGEAFPFCKTGGLADVAGSLPPALAKNGDQVAVILPLYGQIGQLWRQQMTFRRYIYVDLGWRHEYCGLFSLESRGVTWYFVDNEHYFARPRLYGEFDDGERFAFFSKAVIDLLPSLDWMPDVLHCNDWQTALVPVYLKDVATRWPEVRRIRTVFTIHNIEYQGRFGSDTVDQLFGLDRGWYDDGTLQMDGDVNLMKGAMLMADAVTTVSPTYAAQLHDPAYAEGMASVVDMVGWKMHGVVNGIDTDSYDPAADLALPHHYDADHMAGKAACKAALQEELGLACEPDTPLIAMVTRLVGHKGLDLVQEAMDGIMATGCQFVVLGTGEWRYEDFFRQKAWQYGGRLSAQLAYSEALSRRIYAAADLFLMPSRSEPCGLSQMIAMHYGAVPIVRRTGGLADTVKSCQVGQEDGTGYLFESYDAGAMLDVVGQATGLYRGDRNGFNTVCRRGMTADFTWDRSAVAYRQIYANLLG
mgnify:FL=1